MAATVTSPLKPEFSRSALMLRGYYVGPDENIRDAFNHLDRRGKTRVKIAQKDKEGNVRLTINFSYKDPDNGTQKSLATDISFIRKPDDWGDGHDHHIIASVSCGCVHGCKMCVDGKPKSWQADLHKWQMAFAIREVVKEANSIQPIDLHAKIKVLQTGSGDPFAAARNTGPFAEILHLVDRHQRIKTLYTSTAGAFRNGELDIMIAAAKRAKKHGIRVDAQFSTHTFDPVKRKDLIPNPATPSARIEDTDPRIITQVEAAERFHRESGNKAYINYMVVPGQLPGMSGWNNTEKDAELIVKNMPDGCVLKLVEYNDTSAIDGFDVPDYLQGVHCTRKDVLDFEKIIKRKMGEAGKNFEIIPPEDKARVVNAQCGVNNAGNLGYNLPAQAMEMVA